MSLAVAAHDSGVFDRFKRRATPKPTAWTAGQIIFLGEQSGTAEESFKKALRDRFAVDPRIARAYLARVSYPTTGPQRSERENRGPDGSASAVEIALCLAAPEDIAIVRVVAEAFERIFASSQHMDTLFLSDAQERELAKVASPFYRTEP